MSMQMFCLPYAGGSASIYYEWADAFNGALEICPLEYAGRGKRFCDDYFKSIEEAAEDMSEKIIKQRRGEYVIYGHSMGCLVALETLFALKKKGAYMPKAVIIAGTRPPHLMYKDKPLEKMTRDELMQEIFSMGQMEKEIMEDKEMYDIVADIMYADVQMFKSYQRHYNDGKLNVPMLVLAGEDDEEAPEEDMMEWQNYTKGDFEFEQFEGDHFFAFHNKSVYDFIIRYLRRRLVA